MAGNEAPRTSRPTPKRGRVTPKGGPGGTAAPSATGGRTAPEANRRYTPPSPSAQKISPRWVPILMFTFFGLGMLVILANYLSLLPGIGFLPESPDNRYLVGGLVLMVGGFITATKYH